MEHIRGCLKSLDHLSKMHGDVLSGLSGRTIVFAQVSAVSLDGNVMLSTEDVQRNWLDVSDSILRIAAIFTKNPFTLSVRQKYSSTR